MLVDYDEALFTPPAWIAPLLAEQGIAWEAHLCNSDEEVSAAAREADVVLVQSVRRITGEMIAQLARCRCIARLSVGYDSTDLAAATARGIPVCNAPGYCTDDVAEHAWAFLLDGARHIGAQDRAMREGRWDRLAAQPGKLLRGSTLGLIAFGRIGRAAAEKARGFGMTVLAYDPYVSGVGDGAVQRA